MTQKTTSNFVLHAKSDEFYWEGNGQLSIKTFAHGKAQYKTNKGFFAVEEGRYLLLNEGPYTISIEEENEVESFCVFFQDGFAENVFRSLTETQNNLLSDPFKTMDSIGFFEKTYGTGQELLLELMAFKNKLSLLDSVGSEEYFHRIMQTVLSDQIKTIKETESIKALKSSTKLELFKRISLAHEFIQSCFTEPIQLEDIAQVACLSPNHLLRNYTQVFGQTPHQHISELRLQKAKQLLAHTELNMTEITFRLGFQNPVSFSKMFKQCAGISPLQYRKKVILDKK